MRGGCKEQIWIIVFEQNSNSPEFFKLTDSVSLCMFWMILTKTSDVDYTSEKCRSRTLNDRQRFSSSRGVQNHKVVRCVHQNN